MPREERRSGLISAIGTAGISWLIHVLVDPRPARCLVGADLLPAALDLTVDRGHLGDVVAPAAEVLRRGAQPGRRELAVGGEERPDILVRARIVGTPPHADAHRDPLLGVQAPVRVRIEHDLGLDAERTEPVLELGGGGLHRVAHHDRHAVADGVGAAVPVAYRDAAIASLAAAMSPRPSWPGIVDHDASSDASVVSDAKC